MTAAERKADAVKAVVALAGDGDPGDITTNDIAKRMGVSQAALFRHFPTKSDIQQAVMNWVAKQMTARIEAALEKEASCAGALEAMFHAHIEFVSKYPGVPRMIFGELQKPGDSAPRQIVHALIQTYGGHLRGLIRRGQEKGEFAEDIDVDAAAVSFIGIIQGLVVQSLMASRPASVRENATPVFELYLRGISSMPDA